MHNCSLFSHDPGASELALCRIVLRMLFVAKSDFILALVLNNLFYVLIRTF